MTNLRKIVYRYDSSRHHRHCQILKPKENGVWYDSGQKKSVKGVHDLLLREGMNGYEIQNDVWDALEKYNDKQEVMISSYQKQFKHMN